MTSYLDCEFRACLPLDPRFISGRQRLIEIFEQELPNKDSKSPLAKLYSQTHTGPCCIHKDGPRVTIGGIPDPFLCEAAIQAGKCPLGHKPDEVDPKWRIK